LKCGNLTHDPSAVVNSCAVEILTHLANESVTNKQTDPLYYTNV